MNPSNLPNDNSRLKKSLTENVVCQWIGLLLLLLVIAAILFPVFAKVHHRHGGHVSCQSNMKQLGLAIQQYQQDYDGKFPCGTLPAVVAEKGHTGLGWGGQIFDYAKSSNIYQCPSDGMGDSPAPYVSYGYNGNIPRSGASARRMKAPSHTVLLFEVANAVADVTQYDEGNAKGATEFSPVGDGTSAFLRNGLTKHTATYSTGAGGSRPNLYGSWPPGRHTDGSNYLLADGHVKWLIPSKVSTGSDARHSTDSQTGADFGRAAGTANPGYSITYSTK